MKTRTISKKTAARLILILGIAVVSFIIYRIGHSGDKDLLTITKAADESSETSEGSAAEEGSENSPEAGEEDSEMVLLGVHVSGAVKDPDHVWYLPEGSRIADAIEMAGGALKSADLRMLNLAEYVTDSMRIYVPFIGESDPYTGSEGYVTHGEETSTDGSSRKEQNSSSDIPGADLTNINLATKIELMALPGIGETFAQRIIDYREANGPFASIEEIMKVEGIGEKKFEQIKSFITV